MEASCQAPGPPARAKGSQGGQQGLAGAAIVLGLGAFSGSPPSSPARRQGTGQYAAGEAWIRGLLVLRGP